MSYQNLPRIYQEFTKHLPRFYQHGVKSTKNPPNIYQEFTNNLPKRYKTENLPRNAPTSCQESTTTERYKTENLPRNAINQNLPRAAAALPPSTTAPAFRSSCRHHQSCASSPAEQHSRSLSRRRSPIPVRSDYVAKNMYVRKCARRDKIVVYVFMRIPLIYVNIWTSGKCSTGHICFCLYTPSSWVFGSGRWCHWSCLWHHYRTTCRGQPPTDPFSRS